MAGRVPRIGISSCLLGERVRYDGAHKRNEVILGALDGRFELVPFCPEVAIGLGVPRPPIHLVCRGDSIHAVRVDDSAIDVTAALLASARQLAPGVVRFSGYIFKSGSPSCGASRVPVHADEDIEAAGIFARQIMLQHPDLPVEEEDRLQDPAARERFVERVWARFGRLSD